MNPFGLWFVLLAAFHLRHVKILSETVKQREILIRIKLRLTRENFRLE